MNEPVRVWIIDRMFKESLANALYDPARDLAFEQERVDGAPEIVDDGIALDYDAAGIGIDLDLGDLAAVGEVFRNVAQTFTRGVSRKARPDRR
jgi:hypothetical protein